VHALADRLPPGAAVLGWMLTGSAARGMCIPPVHDVDAEALCIPSPLHVLYPCRADRLPGQEFYPAQSGDWTVDLTGRDFIDFVERITVAKIEFTVKLFAPKWAVSIPDPEVRDLLLALRENPLRYLSTESWRKATLGYARRYIDESQECLQQQGNERAARKSLSNGIFFLRFGQEVYANGGAGYESIRRDDLLALRNGDLALGEAQRLAEAEVREFLAWHDRTPDRSLSEIDPVFRSLRKQAARIVTRYWSSYLAEGTE
jgi:hypothetical protein